MKHYYNWYWSPNLALAVSNSPVLQALFNGNANGVYLRIGIGKLLELPISRRIDFVLFQLRNY
jgi:hypothetical protein